VDKDNPDVEIIHRGKYKSLTRPQRRWLKRRQAIEPTIGHLKSDHRMDRCWLQGSLGDALHAVLCGAGYNLRWLMRAIVRLGLKGDFLRLKFVALFSAMVRAAATVTVSPSPVVASQRQPVVGVENEFCRTDYKAAANG
jgi:IS5 family transposase